MGEAQTSAFDTLRTTLSRVSICFLLCTGGGGFDLGKLFYKEVVGDLQKKELKSFVACLLEGKNAKKHPGLKRCCDRFADPRRFGEAYAYCA